MIKASAHGGHDQPDGGAGNQDPASEPDDVLKPVGDEGAQSTTEILRDLVVNGYRVRRGIGCVEAQQ